MERPEIETYTCFRDFLEFFNILDLSFDFLLKNAQCTLKNKLKRFNNVGLEVIVICVDEQSKPPTNWLCIGDGGFMFNSNEVLLHFKEHVSVKDDFIGLHVPPPKPQMTSFETP